MSLSILLGKNRNTNFGFSLGVGLNRIIYSASTKAITAAAAQYTALRHLPGSTAYRKEAPMLNPHIMKGNICVLLIMPSVPM